MEPKEEQTTKPELGKGAFNESLARNNKSIRTERARQLSREAGREYKRKVEDIKYNLEDLKMQQEATLDMSPTNAQSLVLAKEFDGRKFAAEDIELAVEIRNEEIRLKVAQERLKYLFELEIED